MKHRKTGTRFLYMVTDGLPPTVIESQVVELVQMLAREGMVVDILFYDGIRDIMRDRKVKGERLKKVREMIPGRAWFYYIPRMWTLPALVPVVAHVLPDALRGRRVVIHSRSKEGVCIASHVKRLLPRLRVIFDVRGDSAAEMLFSHEQMGLTPDDPPVAEKYRKMKQLEKIAVMNADKITAVSHALRRKMEAEYNLPENTIEVLPCAADPSRFYFSPEVRAKVRRALGIEGKSVMAYVGSMYDWQLPREMLRVFLMVKRHLPEAHLLWVTPEVEKATRLIEEAKLLPEDHTLLSAPHKEVPGYLMAADIGMLLRKEDAVNRVASPTKFAEYVMCGLPVLTTPGIGDLEEMTREYHLGRLLHSLDDEEQVVAGVRDLMERGASEKAREELARTGRQILSKEKFISTWVAIYKSLVEE